MNAVVVIDTTNASPEYKYRGAVKQVCCLRGGYRLKTRQSSFRGDAIVDKGNKEDMASEREKSARTKNIQENSAIKVHVSLLFTKLH